MDRRAFPEFILPDARPLTQDDYVIGTSRVPRIHAWAFLAMILVDAAIFAYVASAI